MRVELPEGYVPPEPTHPLYGYLTPEELAEYDAEERARLGIVPVAPDPGSEETESAVSAGVEEPASPWAPPGVVETEEVTVPGESPPVAEARWVPAPPEPVAQPVVEPVAEPDLELTVPREELSQQTTPRAAAEEYRWDAYRQQWVPAGGAAEEGEEPPPDRAAAAGGRGATSSWTSADGQRFRWDARRQEWIVEGPETPR